MNQIGILWAPQALVMNLINDLWLQLADQTNETTITTDDERTSTIKKQGAGMGRRGRKKLSLNLLQ